MYSLTQGTLLLLKHYQLASEGDVSYDVTRYNTHKIRHSNGVLEIGRHLLLDIQKSQSISPETLNRAEILFLLHDIGRFYQNDKTRILSVAEYDHGFEGAKILSNEDFDDKVTLAVKYHDKYAIDELYKEDVFTYMSESDKSETVFLAKLIRDADKLQNMLYILYDIDGLARITGTPSDNGFSDEVYKTFYSKKPINKLILQGKEDEILAILSWIFDINFHESFAILERFNFFEVLLDSLLKLPGVAADEIANLRVFVKDFLGSIRG